MFGTELDVFKGEIDMTEYSVYMSPRHSNEVIKLQKQMATLASVPLFGCRKNARLAIYGT